MKRPAKITLGENGFGSIVVDGVDIAGRVSAVDVAARPGRPTEATVNLGRVELEVDADIKVDDRTRAALLALGWSPPVEEQPAAHTAPESS